jgi:uncharacterized protein YjbI with pentapeptide repeats
MTSEFSIPVELIEKLEKREVIVFIGNELSRKLGVFSSEDIATKLGSRLQMNISIDMARLAQHYEARLGRNALIQLVRDYIETNRSSLPKEYLLIARLPINTFFTTSLTGILEKALHEVGRKAHSIVVETDLAFWQDDEPQVIRLNGDIAQPNTMVITQRDHQVRFRKNELLRGKIIGLLITKTLLFIGYDTDSYEFEAIYNEIAFDLEKYQRRAYAVLESVDDFKLQELRSRNIEAISLNERDNRKLPLSLERFLETLIHSVSSSPDISDNTRRRQIPGAGYIAGSVILLLEALNYEILDRSSNQRGRESIIYKGSQELRRQVGIVYCVNGEIDAEDVVDMQEILPQDAIGYIVSQSRIAPIAVRLANADPRINVQTLAGFYRRAVNFDSYLTGLVDEYERSDLYKHYIRLSAEKRYYDRAGHSIGQDTFDNLDEYIEGWLEDPGQSHITLLGNFGSGKTSFCQYYAYTQATKCLIDQSTRVPIIVNLRDYTRISSVEQLITDVFVNKLSIPLLGGYKAIDRLNRDGKLLLIFDGFDEMQIKVDSETVLEHFEQLAKIAVPNSKVVVTCRTSYFRSNVEMRTVLDRNLQSANIIDITSRPEFEILHILEFSDAQIRLALQKRLGRDWETVYNQIQVTYDLPSLARRPVLLDMISQSLPYLPTDQSVNQATLYQAYTNQWIQRNVTEERTLLDADQKRYFMREIAWEMFVAQKLTLHYSEIPLRVKDYFRLDKSEDVDFFENDIRTQGFLQRDENGNYYFAHKSFVEYFVADKISKEVISSSFDSLKELSLSSELVAFLRCTLDKDSELLTAELLRVKGLDFARIGYLASNLASILNAMGYSFAGIDLSGTSLRRAMLNGANLTGANFSYVDAEGAQLQRANFRNADFSYSNLKAALLGETKVVRASCFTRDGHFAIYAGSDPYIRMVEAVSGVEYNRIPTFSSVRCLRISPDGNTIISGGADGKVRLWNWKDNYSITSLERHSYSVFCLDCSPNGRFIASGGQDGIINIWETDNYEIYRTFNTNAKYVRCLNFTHDNKYIISGDSEGLVFIWDIHQGSQVALLEDHKGFVVIDLLCTPDGQYLVTTSYDDRRVCVWETGRWQNVLSITSFESVVSSLACHPDGTLLATGRSDGLVQLWDPSSWTEIARFGDDEVAPILAMNFNNNGRVLITGGGKGAVRAWSIPDNKPLWTQTISEQDFDFRGLRITGIEGQPLAYIQYMVRMGAEYHESNHSEE